MLDWAAVHDEGAALKEPAPDDLTPVFTTGGTTGVSEGVCYCYRTLSAIAGNYVDLLDNADVSIVTVRSSSRPPRSPTYQDA